MSGNSGSAVSHNTPLVKLRHERYSLALSKAQMRLCVRGTGFVTKTEVSVARRLVRMGLGHLRDDGSMKEVDGTSDGERWWFTLFADVEIIQRGKP
jgi:hypothetical protein